MKNPDEWMADIKRKAERRLEERRRRRSLVLRCGASAAAVAVVGVSSVAYFTFLKSHPAPVAAASSGTTSLKENSSRPEAVFGQSAVSAAPAAVSKTAVSSGDVSSVSSSKKSASASAAVSQSTGKSSPTNVSPTPAIHGGTTAIAGIADIAPNITYNQIHYNIAGNIIGDDPAKFVGLALGRINGYFVHKGPGTVPLETCKLYSVTGFSPHLVICADTSVGWEFFENDQCEALSGTELYGRTGLNLLNQYKSVSYYLIGKNSSSVTQPQPHKPLNLSKSDLENLFNYLIVQPVAPDLYRDECNFMYRLEIKLNNGTTASVNLWEYSNHLSHDSFIEFYGRWTQLSSSLRQKLMDSCT